MPRRRPLALLSAATLVGALIAPLAGTAAAVTAAPGVVHLKDNLPAFGP